jgi:hypothetical protein
VPHWPDLSEPLEVVWFCRAHRALERERIAEQAAVTAKRAWRTLGERFEAQWPQLPADIQAQLRAEVERSPVFRLVRANPQSPLYQQQLVAAFGRPALPASAALKRLLLPLDDPPGRPRPVRLRRSAERACYLGRSGPAAGRPLVLPGPLRRPTGREAPLRSPGKSWPPTGRPSANKSLLLPPALQADLDPRPSPAPLVRGSFFYWWTLRRQLARRGT